MIFVTKKKRVRKTLLNTELQREICYLLSEGVSVGATCDTVGITRATYHGWIAKGEEGRAPYREFVESTRRARGQARVSLLRKIALLNDWRAHAWLLSHCWPEEFSESGSLQPAQPEPSLQINYGPGVQDMLEQGGQIAKQLANLQLGRKIDPRQKHSKTESKAAKRRHRKRSSPQLKSPVAQQKGMEVLTAGRKAQAA